MPPKTLSRILRILPGYSVVSLFCLILDSLTYTLLVLMGIAISLSAAFGYLFGLVVSYLILTDIGINEERGRYFQKRTMFAVTGILGLTITYFSALWTTIFVTSNPALVKLTSVAFSFITVYLLRTKYVFF